MGRTVAIGIQTFDKIREENYFYIDKTDFIREWWESGDEVTLIARPRRFGKTLNMSMVEQFFSVDYKDRGDLFEGLSIWKEEKYKKLQGTYPVIFLSFANVKEIGFKQTSYRICQLLMKIYEKNHFLMEGDFLSDAEKKYYDRMRTEMSELDAPMVLYQMSDFLCRYYGKKTIILLDEYDTPMQEAYVNGYWDELVAFTRSLFNATFKTNPYLERAIMTGITRVSKESIFSDLNNPKVVTVTSNEYATSFGFTEKEVFEALEEFGYGDHKEEVRCWYDGFSFGSTSDIYNPWSIINFLDTGKIGTYWANSSSNRLAGTLIREGDSEVKEQFEMLLKGESIWRPIDEQVVYNQLDDDSDALWSLLIASGYIKVISVEEKVAGKSQMYELSLTNAEVLDMFYDMVRGWFKGSGKNYNGFVKAMLAGNLKEMNVYMNNVALKTFSYFDVGKKPSEQQEPERFYHGFVLGLVVDLGDEYIITSNRESGLGRYDVMLEPKDPKREAFILEFKVFDKEDEKTLIDTVAAAHEQIEEKNYAANLISKGISEEKIRKYGFAFEGKKVLIG